jgi:uncharacterized membrane protein
MKKQNRNLILPFSVSGTEMNHSMKSIKSKHFLPSMVRRKATPVNMLVYREHAGSATPLRMLELNAVNTNAGVREKKKKRTEKGSVTIDMTEEMMTAEDINEMMTNIAVKVPELKRKDRRNEKDLALATNQQQIKMQRKQGCGMLTLVLPST